LRKRCSTPQKQPAATVAVCIVALAIFRDAEDSAGVSERVGEVVEKERKNREKIVEPRAGTAKAINVVRILRSKVYL
jgi:hypothetical protein